MDMNRFILTSSVGDAPAADLRCRSVASILADIPGHHDYADALAELGFEWCTDFLGDVGAITSNVWDTMLPGHAHRFARMVASERSNANMVGPNSESSATGVVRVLEMAGLLDTHGYACVGRAYADYPDFPDTLEAITTSLRMFMQPGHAMRVALLIYIEKARV